MKCSSMGSAIQRIIYQDPDEGKGDLCLAMGIGMGMAKERRHPKVIWPHVSQEQSRTRYLIEKKNKFTSALYGMTKQNLLSRAFKTR